MLLWKQLQDRYVRAKKKFSSSSNNKSSDPGGGPVRVPPLLLSLSWLDEYVKHRKTANRFKAESPEDFLSSPSGPTQLLEEMVSPYVDKAHSAAAEALGPAPHNSSSQGPPPEQAEIQWLESTLPSPPRSEDSTTQLCSTPIPLSRLKKSKDHEDDPVCSSIKYLLKDCSKMAALHGACAVQGDKLDESHYFGIVVAKGLQTLPDKMWADAVAQVMVLLSNFRQQAFELQTNGTKKT